MSSVRTFGNAKRVVNSITKYDGTSKRKVGGEEYKIHRNQYDRDPTKSGTVSSKKQAMKVEKEEDDEDEGGDLMKNRASSSSSFSPSASTIKSLIKEEKRQTKSMRSYLTEKKESAREYDELQSR